MSTSSSVSTRVSTSCRKECPFEKIKSNNRRVLQLLHDLKDMMQEIMDEGYGDWELEDYFEMKAREENGKVTL